MKIWLAALFFSCATFSSEWVWAEEQTAQRELMTADKNVDSALTQLHQERSSYLATVQASGKDSPQAVAAKARLDTARTNWHDQLNKRQELRHQARREIMHRHHPHPHPPKR